MANPYKAEIEAEIGGITRRLRLGANELVELQAHLGKGPIALLQPGALDYQEAVAVLHFAMRGGGGDKKAVMARTVTAIDGKPALEVIELAARLLMAGMGLSLPADGEDAAGNADAPGANGLDTSPGAA